MFISLIAFGQQKATYQRLVATIDPDETKIEKLEEIFEEIASDTLMAPKKYRENHFKSIGIGFMGYKNSYADMMVVHLHATSQEWNNMFYKHSTIT